MTELLNSLNRRVSYHVHEMGFPAPNPSQLQQILQAAMSTPDHGNLNPWHFLVIEHQQIGELIEHLQQAWQDSEQDLDPQRAKRLANYLKQAPSMILVSAALQPHSKISEQDQILSAAAACQMILLAADGLGFGGVWYSTDAVSLPKVRPLLGLQPQHHPVGFLILGTPLNPRQKKRKDARTYTFQWQGAGQLSPWLNHSSSKQEANK
ncbi:MULTISPECIES: nitroreductase family protein [unclassified Agarivorans]|uniref:nitroreductase family protein n=1 Tax=unclassified Agarivorans TaxID=2636026 RepID=UPI003D7EF88C